ncbi:MAG TPA: T9SS type A sorting domain-containing protein [Ignavibacteria bacterium]
MKKIIFIISVCYSFLIGHYLLAQSGWIQVNSGVTSNLNIVFFPATETGNFGYAAGDNGVILKTTNAGINWVSVSPNQNINFKTIYFLDYSNGWASGWGNDSVYIYHTTNAGINWSKQFVGYDYYNEPQCSFFVNANNGYIGGKKRNSVINSGFDMLTTNGGLNWSKENHLMGILSVNFPTALTGWRGVFYNFCGSNNGELQRTTDGGCNWEMLDHWDDAYFYAMNFVDQNTGVAVGYYNGGNPTYTYVDRTTNRGLYWFQATYQSISVINSVYLIGADKGWMCGTEGLIRKSNDGGVFWYPQNSGVTTDLKSITFTDVNTGYAVGNNGVIIKTTTGGSVGINNQGNVIKDFSLEQNYPNPFNPSTKIKFQIPSNVKSETSNELFPLRKGGQGVVTLKVYDALGKEIVTLVNAPLQPGTYEVTFEASAHPSGIYFYTLSIGDYIDTKKMILLKLPVELQIYL